MSSAAVAFVYVLTTWIAWHKTIAAKQHIIRTGMNETVRRTRADDIAIVTIDNPPVNALAPAVIEALATAFTSAMEEPELRALVLIGNVRMFVAGADIKEFVKLSAEPARERRPLLAPLLSRIEDAPKPVVMALAGPVLGGGLELAMAGHYRVASSDARFAQPEVKLGLIPGAGATQRLPRLVGVAQALVMCAEGTSVDAREAHALGLVDALIEGDLLEQAVAFARAVATRPWPRTRARRDKLGTPEAAAPLVAQARERAWRKQRGLHAPLLAIDAVEAATRLSFEAGSALEQELFTRCLFDDQARALMHVFFAEREAARVPDVPRHTPTRALDVAAVVGAGTMGTGIAMALANAGLPVWLLDRDPSALARGRRAIEREYARAVEHGRLTRALADERLARIQPTPDDQACGGVDLVIEAVFEDLALKREVFSTLDRRCRPGAILATNTSTLDIDALAAATARPEAVVGLHFFNPAPVMRLLEIVRGQATEPSVLATCQRLAKQLGKVGVVVGNAQGFVANRMLRAYRREAQFLVEEGASPALVDQALVEFGMALGPLAVGDLVGLDVAWRAAQEARASPTTDVRQPFAETWLYELGRHGRKNRAGWYLYDEVGRARPDAALVQALHAEARARGLTSREVSADEAVRRCIYALVNAGARVLEAGVALRASDIDIAYVTGLGFPAQRGGPMWHADRVGLASVCAQMVAWQREHGSLWEPAPLLRTLAESGSTFAEFDRRRSTTTG